MAEPSVATPLDEAVATAVAEGLVLVESLEERVQRALDDCLARAIDAAARHGDRQGHEAIAAYQQELHAARAESQTRFLRQRTRLQTFNLVLFGRTGAGKSSLIEALSSGDGAPISQGESDWTTEVRDVRWRTCRLVDTPGIGGWGRTVSRAELEARAERAVEDADVVVLRFDTQSQQAGEFDKVADWVAQYGKPVVAILNCRNPRWRFPGRVPREAARRQLSRSVHEHASNIRDELGRVGLPDVPVVAIHTKRAAFGRTRDPYAGPDAGSRQKLRDEIGAERLVEWSNLPALESLITAALRDHAETLRLGMLQEQARGVLEITRSRVSDEHGAVALAAAEQLERGIADVLTLLGRPTSRDLQRRLTSLEELRAGGFDATADGEVLRHMRNRLAAVLRAPRASALRRAERMVDTAFAERDDLDPTRFESEVLAPAQAEVEQGVRAIEDELRSYMQKRLSLVCDDVGADLAAATAKFRGAKGSAGRGRRRAGVGLQAAGAGSSIATGGLLLAAAANAWNPVGWVLGGLAVGGIASSLLGGLFRKKAAQKREKARSVARSEARRSVNETFEALEAATATELARVVGQALAERLADEVDHATALRLVALATDEAVTRFEQALGSIAKATDVGHLLADVAREVQQLAFPGDSTAERLLWLGEAWCADPSGLEDAIAEHEPARTTAYDRRRVERLLGRLRAFAGGSRGRPSPGAGAAWLDDARDALASDAEATALLGDLEAALERGVPRLVVAGDYSAGKSSFIKRLLVDAGTDVPGDLEVGGQPKTSEASAFEWQGWDVFDTPGFQSAHAAHGAEAHRALVGASVVILLFNPNLVVGDPEDLIAVLLGDEGRGRVGKLRRTLFVINRSDELGVDPHDDLGAYERLCDRKELELAQGVAAATAAVSGSERVDADNVLCVASDPYGMVGDRREVTSRDYDEHRDWDGMEAFHRAFRQAAAGVERNGPDVTVLEGGAAALGALAADRRVALTDVTSRAQQQRRLLLDLDSCLSSGEALRAAARDRLSATLVTFVSDLFDEVGATSDASTRLARVERLEQWSQDPELQELYREWARRVEREVEQWQAATAERVERRLTSASFLASFPELEDAIDVSHLRPEADMDAGQVARQTGRTAAKRATGATREEVTAVAHRLGHKFRPWGATKLTARINVVGGGLGIALGGWELYKIWKGLRREDEVDEEARHVRSSILREVRAASEQFFDGGPGQDAAGAPIASSLVAVATVRSDVAERLAASERSAEELLSTIERCESCVASALARL